MGLSRFKWLSMYYHPVYGVCNFWWPSHLGAPLFTTLIALHYWRLIRGALTLENKQFLRHLPVAIGNISLGFCSQIAVDIETFTPSH